MCPICNRKVGFALGVRFSTGEPILNFHYDPLPIC